MLDRKIKSPLFLAGDGEEGLGGRFGCKGWSFRLNLFLECSYLSSSGFTYDFFPLSKSFQWQNEL